MTDIERDIILKEVAKFLISTSTDNEEGSYHISAESEAILRGIVDHVEPIMTGVDYIVRDMDNAGMRYSYLYDVNNERMGISFYDTQRHYYTVLNATTDNRVVISSEILSKPLEMSWQDGFNTIFNRCMLGNGRY